MTRQFDSEEYDIDRRTILKSAAAASAIGVVGIPAFGGSAAAAIPDSDFKIYSVEHNSHDGTDRPDRLLEIDSSDLDDANSIGDPISVKTYELLDSSDEPTILNTATLAAHPDNGHLYGLHRGGAAEAPGSKSDSQVFRIPIPDGSETTLSVEFVGSPNATLWDIWASAFDYDGNWFGVDSKNDILYEIDPSTGSTTSIGGLTLDEDPYDAVNVGMGINFETGDLWMVAGAKSEGESDVFKVDTADGSLEYAINGENALTDGRLVGGAFGPCANVLYVVRNRHDLYGFDVSDGTEKTFGSLQYTVLENDQEVTYEVGIDNLAVPFGFACEECVVCEDEDLLAKYEFECSETEIDPETEEEVCVNYDFVFEKGDSETVTYEVGNFESKEGEDFEPVSATFGTDYCVWAVVKAGQDFVVQGPTTEDGEVKVTNGDSDHAISFVAFFCTEEAAEQFVEDFPSNGAGRPTNGPGGPPTND